MIDLAATVIRNIGAKQSGKLKVFTDCKAMCDVLTLDRTRASQFTLGRRGIISKITQLENESDVEFECFHVKTRNGDEERGSDYERKLVLECDSIENEFRMKCANNEIIDNVQVRGNLSLKHKNKYYDKK